MTDRIDGWKAIGRHFGRDRSTVIRWATSRGLPVHAIPGGKARTVYALRSELDAWANLGGKDEVPAASPEATATPLALKRRGVSSRLLDIATIAGTAAVVVLTIAATIATGPSATPPTRAALPAGTEARNLYLKARDDWARRTRADVGQSIAELERVTQLDPKFAPAYASLADAFLLEQEVGSLSQPVAFDRAIRAAERAHQLDPELPAAYRALGFIAYWRDGDRPRAGTMFAAAVARDPRDAQTHFWFANVLADNGEDGPAIREFDKARTLDPGSGDIAADLAWANWMAGRDAVARKQLDALIADRPANVEARDCRNAIRLAEGDVHGYVGELAAIAKLRRAPDLDARVATLASAEMQGGKAAVLTALVTQESGSQAQSPFPDHALAAWYASLGDNRDALLAVLRDADRNREIWGAAGYVRRMIEQWRNDRVVLDLLVRRKPARVA